MKCENCNADLAPEAKRCEFCGSHIHPAQPPGPSTHTPSRQELFAQIKSSAEFKTAVLGQMLDSPTAPTGMYLRAIYSFIFCCVTGLITVMLARNAEPSGIVPLVMFAVGLFFLIKSVAAIKTYASASAVPTPAIVAAKRSETEGKNGDASHYFATFEYESGERDELPIYDRQLFGQLADDDAGVLLRRGPIAVGFRRVAV
ncbi:hypothetical protein [Blastopirellula marina]|uniref:Uncharacterized protein n=1 Tax=Blastopirellula marina TaxID=124 RepID=A0A2S8GS27_9BACT|nr:hypothetical protein [Blastopirellula marina]PQO47212.1 hypothetical protein C5Y93_04000 [Blastopirellula marina]